MTENNRLIGRIRTIGWRVLWIGIALFSAIRLIKTNDAQYAAGVPVMGSLEPFVTLFRRLGTVLIQFGENHSILLATIFSGIAGLAAIISLLTKAPDLRRVLCVAGASSIFVWARFTATPLQPLSVLQWILLGTALCLAICAGRNGRKQCSTPDPIPESGVDLTGSCRKWWSNPMWCLGLIMLIAFIFRMVRIDVIPPGQAQHTAEWGMLGAEQAVQNPPGLLNPSDRRFFFDQITLRFAQEPHQQGVNIFADWLLAGWFRPSLVVQRSATAIMGLLSIPALFWVTKMLFGVNAGYVAAFLCAISPWHVAHSRYSSIEHILPVLLVTLSMGLLHMYLRKRSIGALTGLIVILTADFYAYVTAQFIVPVVIVVWTISILQSGRRRLVQGVVLAAALLLVSIGIAPKTGLYGCKETIKLLNTQISEHPDYMVQSDSIIVRNTEKLVRGLFLKGEGDAWFSKQGYLIWSTALLLLLGLGHALANYRSPRYFAVILWFFTGLIPTLPSAVTAPRRILCTMPAIFILAAIGAERIPGGVPVSGWRRKCFISVATVVAVCVVSGSWVVIEQKMMISEVESNGPERRLAEIACGFVRTHRVILCFERHTRLEKIWMNCGDVGPDILKNLMFVPETVKLDEMLSSGFRDAGEGNPAGVVVIFPVDGSGDGLLDLVRSKLPLGEHRILGYDPRFLNHDEGLPKFQTWEISSGDQEIGGGFSVDFPILDGS